MSSPLLNIWEIELIDGTKIPFRHSRTDDCDIVQVRLDDKWEYLMDFVYKKHEEEK